MEKIVKLIINTDGGARGNPGPAGAGAVIKSEQGLVIKELKKFLGESTNNAAEYSALILALEEALSLGATHLRINMDSELIVRQMQGRYKIKQPALQKLAGQALGLQKNFTEVKFTHVRRELNKQADALVNQAIDERPIGMGPTLKKLEFSNTTKYRII